MKQTNMLDVLGVCAKEDVHTNLFKYCMESSREFREVFFASVLNWPSDTPLAGVHTRMSLPEIGLPDMIVAGSGESNQRVAIVELKLHAKEGIDQTNRYASTECLRRILAELETESCSTPDLVFLTLYPNQHPENGDFRAVSLRHLLVSLRKIHVSDDPLASQLSQDWDDCLGEFYDSASLNDDDVLVGKLGLGSALDSGFLCFTEFFESIAPRGLEVSRMWRDSPQGRPYYGIQYRKASWHPTAVLSGNWKSFDPSKHFDIHIECQYHRLRENLDVLVHYETNPYAPKLTSILSVGKFNAHMRRRKDFKASLSVLLGEQFSQAADRSSTFNRIGRINASLTNATVKDCRRQLNRALSNTAKAIDQAILSLS